ncbi:MAG: class II aldolase/adducin family protein [Anaerolineae bacterium]
MAERPPRRTEAEWREEIIQVCQLLGQKGYVSATDGNVSVRLSDDLFLATPSGFSKPLLRPDQLILMDWEGKRVLRSRWGEDPTLKPTSELLLHLEVYRQRPDVLAVVHAHPPTCVALSIAGISLAQCLLPEVVMTLGAIPTTEYGMPSSPEGAKIVRDLIRSHDALVLKRHGTVTVGTSPLDAYLKLEKVEHTAHISYMLHLLGRVEPLPPEEVERLLEFRRKKRPLAPEEEELLCAECGFCRTLRGGTGMAGVEASEALSVRPLVEEVVRRVLAELGRG